MVGPRAVGKMMSARRLFLEQYVDRVNGVLLSVTLGVWAARTRSYGLGGFALLMGIVAFFRMDYETAIRWWMSLVWNGACAVWIGWGFWTQKEELAKSVIDRGIAYGLTASFATTFVILLTGRVRKVWRFCREY
jgi:hypothetical protein